MSVDPRPDSPDSTLSGDEVAADGRRDLSEADSRLLDALSRREPPVVTAVEDQPRTARAAQDDRAAPPSASGRRSPLAPVFQEPTTG